ncbi:MAG: hypothetical protein BLM47_00260 [Candidatus Reconcilbacillus cellulovorans]|uniref:TNase-like domain-containing protein n=1 Tax=Candidatus Reconcilbacillus cellulovorans TaxID=1906605 RepID=A0A2A6E3V8_9BACL|nr:MAG: hypothetical protein BLM47_00260 [Candidatus Reconcilbacillus cellulovorans]
MAIAIAVVIIIWIIENIVGILGLALAGWGLYELSYRKKLSTKLSSVFIAVGLVVGIGWFAFSGSGDESKQLATAPQVTEQAQPAKQQNEPPNQISDKTQQEKPKAATPETNQNAQPQPSQNANESKNASQDAKYIAATVVEIVDGDTIKVKIGDKEETVRLLLVDTPETKDPNEPIQPFGPEATAFAEKTLVGKEVRLEFDGPERDKYDRLLAYLWIGDKIFNQMLLEEGLARVAYVYDPPYTHYEEFIEAEEKAKAEKKGIWSIKGYVAEDGFHEEVAVAKEPEPSSESEPAQQQDVYYASCAAARAAGAAPIYKGEPGYRPALDRDGDGIACE